MPFPLLYSSSVGGTISLYTIVVSDCFLNDLRKLTTAEEFRSSFAVHTWFFEKLLINCARGRIPAFKGQKTDLGLRQQHIFVLIHSMALWEG